MLDLFSKPDSWTKARSRVNVFQFYPGQADNSPCPLCRNNTFENFLTVVPGGAYRWLNDRNIKIALEAGAVKEWNCGNKTPDENVFGISGVIRNIEASGAKVSYIAMDEPFTAVKAWCNPEQSLEVTAGQIKYFISQLKLRHPGLSIGLIEAYPYLSVKEIEESILALEKANVRISFLHIDGHRHGALANNDIPGDLARLGDLSRSRGIDYGVIVWGDDGSSNQGFSSELIMTAATVRSAVGIPDHIIFQSWERHPAYLPIEVLVYPDNVPEDEPNTMTWMLNQMLTYFGIG